MTDIESKLEALVKAGENGLLPCPFCGGRAELRGCHGSRPRKAHCDTTGCDAYHIDIPLTAWNAQYNTLKTALAALKEARTVLEMFSGTHEMVKAKKAWLEKYGRTG